MTGFLTTAVRSGAEGERQLLDALRAAGEDDVVEIVVALGEAEGPGGVAALRELVAGPDDPLEVRPAAIVALTKRQGVEASDLLLAIVAEPDADSVAAGYAVLALAAVGDDRAWDAVLAWLTRVLDECDPHPEYDFEDRTLVAQSDALAAVAYLGRHATTDGERQRAVTGLLRSRWDRLRGAEQRRLTVHWSACDPARPEDVTVLGTTWFADWISNPLFGALYPQGT